MSIVRDLQSGLRYLILSAIAVSVLYPLAWVYMSAIKTQNDIFLHPWGVPRTVNWTPLYEVLFKDGLLRSVGNSLYVAVATVVVSLLLSAMAAYGIARMKWKLSGVTMAFFLFGILIPGHSTLIPLYVNLQWLRNYFDPRLVIMIPYAAFGLSTAVFIIAGFMKTIPREMEESAVIDGSSLIGAFFRIVLPMCVPALSTVAIFAFIGAWNELLFALVFLVRSEDQTIPVALLQFVGVNGTDWVSILAGIAVTMTPSILIYVLLQKRIVQGVTSGAVKI